MEEAFAIWFDANRDLAFWLGFLVFAGGSYALTPYSLALSRANQTETLLFGDMDVKSFIRKPRRRKMTIAAIVSFTVIHWLVGQPLVALVVGSAIIFAMIITDIFRLEKEFPEKD